MKAILVVDMPVNGCESCMFDTYGHCIVRANEKDSSKRANRNWCPLKPIHAYALKSAGHDYIIYERQYLYKNLEREYELLKKAREYESNISG